MAASKASGSGVRVRFTIADDLALLREVLLANPFRDPQQWNHITTQLQGSTQKMFTVRAVRERCDLLLAQYASDDRTNLRKSGTEEEYSEREHLLQELLDLAREFGYRFKAPRKGNGAAATPARERSMTPAAARSSAAAARDSAADVLVAPGNTADFSGACSGEQATAEELFTLILSSEDVGSPAVPSGGSGEGTDQPDTARAETCQGHSAPASPCPTARNEPMRGKRKQDHMDYDYLEKRMKHDSSIKKKEFILEARRLSLEESRLAWEKEQRQEERQERAEERRLSAAQQQSFLNILEGLLSRTLK
ncbi:unnamed protein product [Ixodes persulcatus]